MGFREKLAASQPQPIPEEMRPGAWVPKVGELLRCVSKHPAWGSAFEIGKVYRVTGFSETRQFPKFAHTGECIGYDISHFEPADALADRLDSVIEAQRAPCGCRAGCLGYVCGFNPMPIQKQAKRHDLVAAGKMADPYWQHQHDLALKLQDTGFLPPDGQHRESLDHYTRLSMEALDTGANMADKVNTRRARLIDALAAEQTDMAKKFQPRFPAEGRSCRVYKENE
jgi:hypothetical protein